MSRNKMLNLDFSWFFVFIILEIIFLLTANPAAVLGNTLGMNSKIPTNTVIWDGTKEYVAKSVAVAPDGCSYVTGYLKEDPNKPYDVFVRKYEKNYSLIWETIWGDDDLNDKAEDIAIDSEGLIVITGGREHSPNSGNYNGFVAFFEPNNGGQKGNETCSHDWSQYLWGIDVSLDPSLKLVYTAGDSYYDYFGDYDALYIIWNYTDMSDITPYIVDYFLDGHNGGLVKDDRAYDIKTEANNGFIIVGETESLGSGMSDAFIALYHPTSSYTDFNHINHKTWGSGDKDYFHGVVLEKPSDSYSHIYACGSANKTSINGYGAALVKYNSSFDLQWDRMLDRSINETYFDVCISSDDYLYTTGFSYKNDLGSANVLTSQYQFAGTEIDNSNWDNKDDDHGYGVIGGLNKEILVCGGTNFTTTTPLSPQIYGDAFLIEYGGTSSSTTTTTTTTATNSTTTTSGTPGFTTTVVFLSLMTVYGAITILRRKKKSI